MTGMTIRPSSPADAEAVESLRIAGWKTAYQGIMPDDYLDGLPVDVGDAGRQVLQMPTAPADVDLRRAELAPADLARMAPWSAGSPTGRVAIRTTPVRGTARSSPVTCTRIGGGRAPAAC